MESWKAVPGYEGLYEASDCGRIRSVSHLVKRRHLVMTKPKILRPRTRRNKRMNVVLCKDARKWYAQVHQVVMLAFVGQRPEGLEVNHKDGDPTNNELENLEYVTKKENCLHSCRVLGRGRGENHGAAKLTDQFVREIRSSTESHAALARRLGVPYNTIYFARTRRSWAHVV